MERLTFAILLVFSIPISQPPFSLVCGKLGEKRHIILKKLHELALSNTSLSILGMFVYLWWTSMQSQLLCIMVMIELTTIRVTKMINSQQINICSLQIWPFEFNHANKKLGWHFIVYEWSNQDNNTKAKAYHEDNARDAHTWHRHCIQCKEELRTIFTMTMTMESSNHKLKDLLSFWGQEDQAG